MRRPPARTDFTLQAAWTRVEFERRYRNVSTKTACRLVAETELSDGRGYGIHAYLGDDCCKPDPETGIREFRHVIWDDPKTIRRRYSEACALLSKRPELRESWEFNVRVTLEAWQSKQTFEEVIVRLRTEQQISGS